MSIHAEPQSLFLRRGAIDQRMPKPFAVSRPAHVSLDPRTGALQFRPYRYRPLHLGAALADEHRQQMLQYQAGLDNLFTGHA